VVVHLLATALVEAYPGCGHLRHGSGTALDPRIDRKGLGEGSLQCIDGEAATLDEETEQAMPEEVEFSYVVSALPDRGDAGVADYRAERLKVVERRLRVQ
jgi:hypothetical protein